MDKKLKILNFLIISMLSFNSYSMLQKVKNMVGTVLTYPIAHEKSASEIQDFTKETVKIIDPTVEITSIKKLNKLGQLIFGYQNTIAIPFLNFLIINEKWFNELPEQAKKFIIGRCGSHLSNKTKYVAYKYLLPFFLYNFLRLTLPKDYVNLFPQYLNLFTQRDLQNANTKNNQDFARFDKLINKALKLIIYQSITNLVCAYFSRALEYQADEEVTYKLKCPDHAIEVLKNLNKFKHDKSNLGSICSKIPFLKLLNSFLFPFLSKSEKNFKFHDILLLSIYPASILSQIERNTPGRINNVSNRLENFFIHLPIANWFSNFPRIADRIKQIRNVAKKLREENQEDKANDTLKAKVSQKSESENNEDKVSKEEIA